jgi:hypothetical protein
MPTPPASASNQAAEMAAVQASTAAMQDVKGFGLSMLTNRWNRKYNEKMYDKQRQDALSDWQRTADYNSPQAQMIRYKEAGLNPNLIYGSATNSPMAQMKGPTMETSELPPYQLNKNNVGDAIGTYQNLKITNLQADNLATQNELLKSQINYNNVKALTEPFKQNLMEQQTTNEFWKTKLNQRQDSHLNVMNPHLQSLIQEKLSNVIADTALKQGKTSMIPGMVALNAEKVISERLDQAKTKQETSNLQEALKLTRSNTFKNELENLMRIQGTSFSDSRFFRSIHTSIGDKISPSINNIYSQIVPNWDKMSDKDKMYYIMHESLNK